MMDEEIESPSMDVDTTSAVLDLGLGTGHISGSDDELDNTEPTTSKSSTPDSLAPPVTIVKKPLTTVKHPLTKNKSSLVSYGRDSDDDEHTDDDDDDNQENDNTQEDGDGDDLSGSAGISQQGGETDTIQLETIPEQTTIITSDLLSVTPLRPEDGSPSIRGDVTPSHTMIFPEDADIRIPPEPAKSCSAKLEKKFEEYYRRYKKTGVDQNGRIQELKDFRNPSMYEKMISHLGIDEIGTNFPPELYDPHWWGKESYYEELGKAQKLEMDRREKERRERTKISYVTAVKKVEPIGVVSTSNVDIVGEKRKTRFDM